MNNDNLVHRLSDQESLKYIYLSVKLGEVYDTAPTHFDGGGMNNMPVILLKWVSDE